MFEHLNWLDVSIIILFFAVIFGISAYYSRRAGKDMQQFFLSGRNLPWYLAGTAMVATTFAADTPLAVTELIAKNGIAGNWLWWNMAIGGILTVFFFARLWRRSGVMTDLEFIEFRYSGKPASFLRGFRAIYLGLFMNAVILGWVHKAMEKIFLISFPGINPVLMVAILAIIIGIYASASGLLGTIRTDSFQFVFALAGCIVLAVLVVQVPEVGSMGQLKAQLPTATLEFFPRVSNVASGNTATGIFALSAGAFAAYALVQWWASWYPGADPGGGGYIAQRMMSAKDERQSLLATLWFNVAHYTLRPWPWIIVALAALVILPRAQNTESLEAENPALYVQVEETYKNQPAKKEKLMQNADFAAFYEKYENTVDPGVMYPKLMIRYLPAGVLGLLLAVFMAAYMSTVASQLNWGTSYLINDFYKRFVRSNKSEKHYIAASRITIMLMVAISLLVAELFLSTISGAWEFIINASAGLGAVLILRWYWWRVNAWTEIAAMIAPLVFYPVARYAFGMESPLTLFPTVLGSTLVWVAVAFLSKPVEEKTLHAFFRKVHPGGIGWRKIARQNPDIQTDSNYGRLFVNWGCGIITIYATLYGTGKLLFEEYLSGGLAIGLALLAGVMIYINMGKDKDKANKNIKTN